MGSGTGGAGEQHESNTLMSKSVVRERSTNKTSFKQWGRRYNLVSGAKGERFKVLLEWAEA